MKGDFSRLTFDSSKHYERVLMQQGRVQLDADWNEQQEILAHRIETEIADLIGPSGAPEREAGFEITPSHTLDFDGVDDYILLSPPAVQMRARYPSFTIELRVRARTPVAGGTLISSLGFGEAGEYSLMIETDGTITFRMLEGQIGAPTLQTADPNQPASPPGPDVQVVDLHTTRAIPTDTVCHVAVTVDGGEAVIYLAGQVAARRAGLAEDYRGRLPLVIGAAYPHGRGVDHFGGIIEEVRFWSVARTREEILAFRDRSVAPTSANLVSYWPLDEGRGTAVADRTGRGNEGLLGGGVFECSPRWTFQDLAVGAGRYYVNGILCENEQKVLLTSQPDVPGVCLPLSTNSGWFLVYLDVWKRHLTAIEDPSVREVGLGGPDTTTRLKTVWQVRLLPLGVENEILSDGALVQAWDTFTRQAAATAMLRAQRSRSAPGLSNLLYRVEIHDGNHPADQSTLRPDSELPIARAVQFFPATNEVSISPASLEDMSWEIGQTVAFSSDQEGDAGRPVHLARIVDIDAGRHVLGLDAIPPGDVRASAIYLRRVATFKWSRENGSIAFPVQAIDPAGVVVTLGQAGQDYTALRPGDWVEVTDDASVLQRRGGLLAQISTVDYSRGEVVLNSPLADAIGRDPTRHPLLRRWDHGAGGEKLIGGVLAATGPEWITLERGIQVSFEEHGQFRVGDYWLIPARAVAEDVEWPRDAVGPIPLAPRGIRHCYCLLAAVRFHSGFVHVLDLRRTFSSLTDERSHDRSGGGHDSSRNGGDEWSPNGHHSHPIEVGSPVPPGFSILGPTPNPPRDFAYTGHSLLIFNARRRATVPMRNLGRLHCAVLDNRIFLIADSGEVWEYDPRSDRVESRAYLRPARYGFGLAVAHGRLFAMGGIDLDGQLTDRTSEYEPSADRWINRMPMRAPRCHLAAATVHGKVFAIGGQTATWLGRRTSRLNEEYDPERDRWSEWRPMPTARSSLAVAGVDGKIFAIGGEQPRLLPWLGTRRLRVTEQYDPKSDSWARGSAMPTPRSRLGLAELDGKLYVTGGARPSRPPALGRWSDVAEEYDPSIDCWTSKEPIAIPRFHFGLVAAYHEIYAVGKEAADDSTAVIESVARSLYVHRNYLAIAQPATVEEHVHV